MKGCRLYVARCAGIFLVVMSIVGMASDVGFSKSDFAAFDIFLGKWKMRKSGSDLYEVWVKDKQKQLKATTFRVAGKDTTQLESVRLFYKKGKIVYAPVVHGQNARMEVPFELISLKNNSFVFHNEKHDYPQHIVYTVIGADSIHAYIEGKMNGKTERADYFFSRIK